MKLRSGDYSFKYLLSRPGGIQKRGLYIQIFTFSPRWSLEAGTIHSNIRFFDPVKLRSGDYSFIYLLSRPGTVQMRGLFIHIFASSPRHSSEAGTIHSYIRFFAPVGFRSRAYTFKYLFSRPAQSRSGLNIFTDRHIQIHIKQITRSEILRQYRKITLRVIFISYQSNCQHKKVNTDNLSASTSTTAQIFDANQIQIYPIRRYRIRK